MKVNTKQAIRLFFQNPSLEMVFKEALANSLDANATNIDIHIFIDSFEKQETLKVEITDNGEGFTDERYDKFCELLKVEEETPVKAAASKKKVKVTPIKPSSK